MKNPQRVSKNVLLLADCTTAALSRSALMGPSRAMVASSALAPTGLRTRKIACMQESARNNLLDEATPRVGVVLTSALGVSPIQFLW